MKLSNIKDQEKLRGMVRDLWCLLDDIDTLDDQCRGDDKLFRKLTYQQQQKRHNVVSSETITNTLRDL